jgi:integrase
MAKKNEKRKNVRKDGMFMKQVYIGVDENGKRVYKSCYGKSLKEVEEKAATLKVSLRKGLDIASASELFKMWSKRWLDQKKLSVNISWYGCCRKFSEYLDEYFGHIEIGKVRTVNIQEVINDLAIDNPHTNKPSSKKLLSSIKSTANQIFTLAIENRVVEFNPAEYTKIPKTPPVEERRALSREEIEWVNATDHRAKTAAMIMTYAGLRRGELIPLSWSDINLKEGTISITKSVERHSNKFVVKPGAKTDAGIRVVDIPENLIDFLASLKRETILVCPSAKGVMHTDTSWRSMWTSYLGEINRLHGDFGPFLVKPKSKFDRNGTPFVINKFTPHECRHTFATMLYFAGMDALTAAAQMGHADPKVTLSIYTHLDKTHKRKNIDKLNEYLSSGRRKEAETHK